ncbi:unnamed protein product [Laminaria digitata]
MEDSMDGLHKQERALRGIQVVATSGFLRDKRSLKRSCLVMCNLCRESLPLRWLRIGLKVPPTLLAVFWPDLLCTKAEGVSRVLLPKRVLKVKWTFNDPATADIAESEDGEEEEDEDGDGDKDEDRKEENQHQEEEGEEEEEEDKKEEENGKDEDDTINEGSERSAITAYHIDMSKVSWPEGVREIYLTGFNRPVDDLTWPSCLEVLAFHIPPLVTLEYTLPGTTGSFNRPLDGVTFSTGLREIPLGHEFNQRIDGVVWPKGLERLSIPGLNQPIHDVQWPPGLKTLELMKPYQLEQRDSSETVSWERQDGTFNQPLGSFLPMSLETLWLSNKFDQSLRGVTWPSGLALLSLGVEISEESLDGVEWPSSLQTLVVAEELWFGLQDVPACCDVVGVCRRDIPDSDEDENSMDSSNVFEDSDY